MDKEAFTLKNISWKDLFPWVILFRTVGVAFRPAIWIVALIGLMITPLGWLSLEYVLLPNKEIANPSFKNRTEKKEEKTESDSDKDKKPSFRTKVVVPEFWKTEAASTSPSFDVYKTISGSSVSNVFGKFAASFVQMLDGQLNFRQFLFFLLGSIWMIGVWSLFGGMICRIATTHLTRDERTGPIEAFFFCKSRIFSLVISASIPLILIFGFTIPLWVVGLIIKVDFLFMVASYLWFLVILIGLIMAVLLVPLFFGWPLLWPAVATENADPFDAISRGYSYPTQRPFRYVGYLFVLSIVGSLAIWFVGLVGYGTKEFSNWGASWGAGYERMVEIEQAKAYELKSGEERGENDPPAMRVAGAKTVKFWEKGIDLFIISFQYGFFFVGATGIYLILRKDTDNTEMDEVYLEDDLDPEPLPTIQTPPEPVAQVESPPAVENSEPAESADAQGTDAVGNDAADTGESATDSDGDDDGEIREESE